MSIIYDALKKTQTNRETNINTTNINKNINTAIEKKASRINKWFDGGLVVLIISLLVTTVYVYFPGLHSPTPVAPIVIKPSLVQLKKELKIKSTVPNYQLNGVFLSEKNSIAMINNESYKLGDVINGMKIISISLNKVTLQNDNDVIELTQV